MCTGKAYVILENPEDFKGALRDAGLEDVDLSVFAKDEIDGLNIKVTEELEKHGVKDEWKNYLEAEPFVFWEDRQTIQVLSYGC